MIDWYPAATQQRAATKYWGTFTGGPFKGVLHTTETSSLPVLGKYYTAYNYPHFTVGMKDGRPVVLQHIPVTRAARAMVNGAAYTQTNLDSAIQIEIVWRAAEAQNMPVALLDAIGHLMRWVESNCGVERRVYDSFHYYPPENGIRLNGQEPWRMPLQVWDTWPGWCGHQHVPDGNVHGDPGKINTNHLLTVGVPKPILEDELMIHSEVVTIPPPELVEGRQRQLVTLKNILLLADKVGPITVRTQNMGIPTNAVVQKTEFAGILVLSFYSFSGGVAGTGNCVVDVVYTP